jgi:hypothetical protein
VASSITAELSLPITACSWDRKTQYIGWCVVLASTHC